jgi:hypothetical protein
MDGLINPDAIRDDYTGDFIDDKTGLMRFVNLQEDLLEDVTDFEAITVVNYPWVKPNAFPPQGGSFGTFDSYPPDGALQQNGHGLSDIEWSEARDALRDSILQAAYDGVSLWIGEWHAAQHLGFIQDVDLHTHGYWGAGGTDPNTGVLDPGANVEAQILDRIHLDPDNSKLGTDYYNTGTKAHPTASDIGLPTSNQAKKYVGYLPGVGASYYNWIYSAGGGWYDAEPQMNHYRRVVADVPDITNLPTTEYLTMVQGRSWDRWKPNGDFQAYDIVKKPNGLTVGDYCWMNIVMPTDTAVRSLRQFRTQIISARPEGIAGQVVTREMEAYWGPGGIVVDNPFKNNAFTIAAEVGTIVRGKPIGGRAFIELMEGGGGTEYIREDVDKSLWLGTPNSNVTTWDYDSRRAKETSSITLAGQKWKGDWKTGNVIQNSAYLYDIQIQLLPYNGWGRPSWHYRGLNWLSKAVQRQPGEAISFPAPMTLDISMPAPTLSKTANPVSEVTGAMTLFLEERQPANYRDGSVLEFGLAMELSVAMGGIGSGTRVPPITLSVTTPGPALDVSRETIPVFLDNDRTVTLFLKEEI